MYDPESFETVEKYGLRLQVSADQQLQAYLTKILAQLQSWLETGAVKQLVLVINSVDTGEVLERWCFAVQTDEEVLETNGKRQKSEKVIQKEIGVILRQITSSVSFLPLLEGACAFDLLVYTKSDCAVPQAWEESSAHYIAQSSEVRLHSFTTKVHQVAPSVTYKVVDSSDDEEEDAKR